MDYLILVINPGSTSTKVALYENEKEKCTANIEHTARALSSFLSISEQGPFRKEAIMRFVKSHGVEIQDLSAVVGRGGLLPPVKSGAYQVNQLMVDTLTNNPVGEHASNLGAIIAYDIARPLEIPAYIYDAVAVDEMEAIAKITGLREIRRKSLVHTLNMRAAVLKTVEEYGFSFADTNYVVAHLGGGISIGLFAKGKMIDIVSDDEGPMSPERAGRIPAQEMIRFCSAYQHDKKTLARKLRGQGGFLSHLGTNNTLEVEEKIKAGDQEAEMLYRAMAYQVIKGIGELAAAVGGKVKRIIMTGGIAHSKILTKWVKEQVEFICPVEIIPGENEMEALAWGALRVLRGQEKARNYEGTK
ncbi:MAG: butyrate kinase [Clostridia bacterium]|nr:butyrate kinase [Clostridia bacterium]